MSPRRSARIAAHVAKAPAAVAVATTAKSSAKKVQKSALKGGCAKGAKKASLAKKAGMAIDPAREWSANEAAAQSVGTAQSAPKRKRIEELEDARTAKRAKLDEDPKPVAGTSKAVKKPKRQPKSRRTTKTRKQDRPLDRNATSPAPADLGPAVEAIGEQTDVSKPINVDNGLEEATAVPTDDHRSDTQLTAIRGPLDVQEDINNVQADEQPASTANPAKENGIPAVQIGSERNAVRLVEGLLSEIRAQRMVKAFTTEMRNLDRQLRYATAEEVELRGVEQRIAQIQGDEDPDDNEYDWLLEQRKELHDLTSSSWDERQRLRTLDYMVDFNDPSSDALASPLHDIQLTDVTQGALAILGADLQESIQRYIMTRLRGEAIQCSLANLSKLAAKARIACATTNSTLFARGKLPEVWRAATKTASGGRLLESSEFDDALSERKRMWELLKEHSVLAKRADKSRQQLAAARSALLRVAEDALEQVEILEYSEIDQIPEPSNSGGVEVEVAAGISTRTGDIRVVTSGRHARTPDKFADGWASPLRNVVGPGTPVSAPPGHWHNSAAQTANLCEELSIAIEAAFPTALRERLRSAAKNLAAAHQRLDCIRDGRVEYPEGLSQDDTAALTMRAKHLADLEVMEAEKERINAVAELKRNGVLDELFVDPLPEPEGVPDPSLESHPDEELIADFHADKLEMNRVYRWMNAADNKAVLPSNPPDMETAPRSSRSSDMPEISI
ncbi:hypothetical protein B0A48_10561 [Cryoendolithus antarcticus]|uniref:Uncharacterized protein n=1 Tax=Cryoendolithus antarcticus TaxID=1507870 RepID=A0A1V8SXX2_9PEZI|nr:hypothetical protein B0A48_10561 [Cryoendolithus antarcticus]